MPGIHLAFVESSLKAAPVNFHPPDRFAAQQVIALVVVLAVLALAVAAAFFARQGGGLLMGADGRLSTSKAVAVLWTAIVGYCVLTLAFIATKPNFGVTFLEHNLGELKGIYLALLGGPYASYLFAQIAVPAKMARGTLQKGYGTGFNPADIINNDMGNTDVIDLQYVSFNLIAAIMVLVLFIPHPALQGLPRIPYAVAILTGGAAATYVLNKGLTTNQAKITSLSPQSQRVGDVVTIAGVNLWGPTAAPPTGGSALQTAVSIAGLPGVVSLTATVVQDEAPSAINFLVPALPATVPPPLTSLDVTLSTDLNHADTAHGFTIIPDVPAISGIAPNPATAGAEVTVLGRFLAGPPTLGTDGKIVKNYEQPVVTLDGVQLTLKGTATPDRLVFYAPSPPPPAPAAPAGGAAVAPGPGAPVPAQLIVTRSNAASANAMLGLI